MSAPRLIWLGVCGLALIMHLFAIRSGRINLGEIKDIILDRRERPTSFWAYSVGVTAILLRLIWLGFTGTIVE